MATGKDGMLNLPTVASGYNEVCENLCRFKDETVFVNHGVGLYPSGNNEKGSYLNIGYGADAYILDEQSSSNPASSAYSVFRTSNYSFVKRFTYKYSLAANNTIAITATNLGITYDPSEYMFVVLEAKSGSVNNHVYGVNATNSGTVMNIRNISGSDTNVTARISIAFIKL